MSSWDEVRKAAPELVALAEERFSAHGHKTMVTLRRDGSPRISGTEMQIRDGVVWLAGMAGARRFADLRHDPRIGVHSGSDDGDAWCGDAKISGRAVEVTSAAEKRTFAGGAGEVPPGPFELFRVDVGELVVVRLAPTLDRLVIESWAQESGVRRWER